MNAPHSWPQPGSRWWLPALALAGWGQAIALAVPAMGRSLGWLQILSLAAFAFALRALVGSDGPMRSLLMLAGRHTAVFASCWLAGVFWWLHVSMHEVGGLPAPLSMAAVGLLALCLAGFYALASLTWLWLVRRANWGRRPWLASGLFAALWLMADLMRGRWLTGFPWGAGGYAHVDGWLAAAAPWVGVYGMGALAAFLAMRLAWWRTGGALWSSGLVLTGLLWGVGQLPGSDAFTRSAGWQGVELLQANIAQVDKFEGRAGVREALEWYGERLLAARQPLVVAPETALPLLPQHWPEGYGQALQAHFAQSQQLALVGAPWGNAVKGYTNALLAFGPQALTPYRYDKFHLVPFGEFIPPGFAWFVRALQIPLGDFERGPAVQPSMAWQGQRLAPNICYEDLFGEELAARFADEANAPTVLVNASNIAWFGDTVAVDQHLNISRLRAMELGRPMLRATNTGATAIIDHRGQVQAMLPRFTRGVLVGTYEGRVGLTPYARWVAAWGLWPLWAWALGWVGWAWWCGRRR